MPVAGAYWGAGAAGAGGTPPGDPSSTNTMRTSTPIGVCHSVGSAPRGGTCAAWLGERTAGRAEQAGVARDALGVGAARPHSDSGGKAAGVTIGTARPA